MGPKPPEQYFQNANEEKQFFWPSHQNALQSKLYSLCEKKASEREILVLYGGVCDNRRDRR